MKAIKIDPREHKVNRALPASLTCFGCSDGPSECLGIRAYRMEDGSACAKLHTKLSHQSFPGVIHGGIVASYMDEIAWYSTWEDDYMKQTAMTAEISVKFLAPVPPETDITLWASPAQLDGRHCYIDCKTILEDGTLAATARVHYIILKAKGDDDLKEEPRMVYGEDRESLWY